MVDAGVSRTISYTVEKALSLPCLASARLVAGSDGVGRAVESVGVLDVTDFEGIRRHQLVLSNAYPLLDLDLGELARRLTEAGAAGLALILSDYWSQVPDQLAHAADQTSLPVLVLPESPFDEIVNPLLTAIAGHQLEALHRSMAVHDELTRAALREEGDPSSVAHIVTEALKRPTAIFSDRGQLLALAGDDIGWERVAASAVGETRGGVVQVNGQSFYVASAPARGTPRAVVAVEDVDPHDTFARSTVTHAAVVAGMLLVGRQQVEEVYRRYERELFEDLTEGRTIKPEEARSRASQIGWPLHRPYLVMVIGQARSGTPNGETSGEADAFGEGDLATLGSVLSNGGFEARLFLQPPGAGVVVHLRSSDNPASVVERIAGLLDGMEPPWRHRDIVVGVGRPRRDVAAVSDAFAEAKLAFRFHRHVHPAGLRATHFSDLGPIGLLSLSTNPSHLLKVARSTLGSLANPALSRRDDLIATLRTVLARNMNLRVAADELFFHYNTVRHRMSRLRTILGDALDDPERRLLLSLAVSTLELYEERAEELMVP